MRQQDFHLIRRTNRDSFAGARVKHAEGFILAGGRQQGASGIPSEITYRS